MNEQLVTYAKKEILAGLLQLPEDWQFTFKRMYSHKDLEKPIGQVVADMTEDKLDRAMVQVQMSLDKYLKASLTNKN